MARVLTITFLAFACGAAALYAASRSADAATRRERLIQFAVDSAMAAVVIASGFAGQLGMIFLALAITGRGAYELYGSLRRPTAAFRTAVCAAYVLLGITLLCFAIVVPPRPAVFTYVLVAAFEGFGRAAGQLWGRNRPGPGSVPAKTVEGAIGGAFAALLLAMALGSAAGLGFGNAAAAWAGIAAAALIGDLTASWVKRRSGIQSFGRLLADRGGVLDRFDGVLFAAPVALLLLR